MRHRLKETMEISTARPPREGIPKCAIAAAGRFIRSRLLERSLPSINSTSPTAMRVQASVLGTDGNFYGTTTVGTSANAGVIVKISPAGKFTLLFSFDTTHGENPFAHLVPGADGNFYRTRSPGAATGGGVVFKITPSGKLTVLHNINGTTDGAKPYGGLVLASDGNFYGANSNGGTVNSNCADGCGTLFKITPKGAYSVLYKFDYTTGATPYVTPFQHTSGQVYGDSQIGGTGNVNPCSTGNCGAFYGWKNTSLPAFVSLLPYSGKVGKVIDLGPGLCFGEDHGVFQRDFREADGSIEHIFNGCGP